MQHECLAPHRHKRGAQCGAVFYARADAVYCSAACRKRAHNARPEAQRQKRMKAAREQLARERANMARAAAAIRALEGELAILESFDARQLDLAAPTRETPRERRERRQRGELRRDA